MLKYSIMLLNTNETNKSCDHGTWLTTAGTIVVASSLIVSSFSRSSSEASDCSSFLSSSLYLHSFSSWTSISPGIEQIDLIEIIITNISCYISTLTFNQLVG